MKKSYRIPRRIIQTGKHASQPLLNRAMMANVRLLNPEFEYIFFDNQAVEAFIDQDFPQYKEVFNSFPFPIQKYDFFRYLAIYHYGGFYFDLDVLLASGLSDLLELGCVFPFEGLTLSRHLRRQHNMDWEVGNYAFGAEAGHPFLKAVIDDCVRAQRDPQWTKPMMQGMPSLLEDEYRILNTTGPGLVSRTLAENPDLAQSITVLFPEDVCDERTWNRFGEFGVHLMDGSWRMKSSFLRRRMAQYQESWKLQRLLKESRKLGGQRYGAFGRSARGAPEKGHGLPSLGIGNDRDRLMVPKRDSIEAVTLTPRASTDEPLVSILIPAFNAQEWIYDTIQSAAAQTWQRKEIIVVDDGSSDRTLAIARQFESDSIRVITQKNLGAAAARNAAYRLCRGDYIQWLDADDLLAPDKIAKQLAVLEHRGNKRTLLSSAWGRFIFRQSHANFIPTQLWQDLSPVEWLLLKMERNLYMQTATWLVSRELAESAGSWNTDLIGDDDGEYFCRVLLASAGTIFVPDAKIYYRGPGVAFGGTLSYIWGSAPKLRAHWNSAQLHVAYLLSLEDSQRARRACEEYLRASLIYFYPGESEILREARELALSLEFNLDAPSMRGKYFLIEKLFGWSIALRLQVVLRKLRWTVQKHWDKMLFQIQRPGAPRVQPPVSSVETMGTPAKQSPVSESPGSFNP